MTQKSIELHFDIEKLVEKHRNILELLNNKEKNQSMLVGGCVRDFLQFGTFSSDVDISTILKPKEVIEVLKKYKKNNQNQNITILDKDAKYGTIIAIINEQRYEITTTRADIDCFGRQANIEFCESFEVDSNRRDFTINALYVGIDSKIYDFHNGITDLKKQIVNFIGDAEKRIKEDYLRIIRFFRFSAKFDNLNFNNEIIEILQQNKEGLLKLSRERIRSEVYKILDCKNWFLCLKNIEKYGFIENIFLIQHYKTANNLNFFKNISDAKYTNIVKLFYFFDKNIEIIDKFIENLRFTNEEKKFVVFLKNISNCLINFEKNNELNFKLKVIFFDTIKSNKKDYIYSIFQLLDYKKQEKITEFMKSYKETPIKADDLIKLGYSGRKLGEKLEQTKENWIKNNFTSTKEQLLSTL